MPFFVRTGSVSKVRLAFADAVFATYIALSFFNVFQWHWIHGMVGLTWFVLAIVERLRQ